MWYIPRIYSLSRYTWYIRGMYRLYTSSGFQMCVGTCVSTFFAQVRTDRCCEDIPNDRCREDINYTCPQWHGDWCARRIHGDSGWDSHPSGLLLARNAPL